MNRQQLKEFILDFYQAWRDRDENRIKKFYDPNVKAHADSKEITLNDMLNRLEFIKGKFSKSSYNIKDVFVDEDQGQIAVRMDQEHIRRDGTGVAECQAIMLYKVADKKIKEIWMSFCPNIDYTDNT